MSKPIKGKCNKCGREYDAALIGLTHKCGRGEEGLVIGEGRDATLLDVHAGNILSLSNNENLARYNSEYPEVSFLINDVHEIKPTEEEICDKVEQDIVDWLIKRCSISETSLDKFTLRYIVRAISDKRYLDNS